MMARPSLTFNMILHILKSNDFSYNHEFLPVFWRINCPEMEEIDLDETIEELGIRDLETIMISRIDAKKKKDETIYLQLKFKKS